MHLRNHSTRHCQLLLLFGSATTTTTRIVDQARIMAAMPVHGIHYKYDKRSKPVNLMVPAASHNKINLMCQLLSLSEKCHASKTTRTCVPLASLAPGGNDSVTSETNDIFCETFHVWGYISVSSKPNEKHMLHVFCDSAGPPNDCLSQCPVGTHVIQVNLNHAFDVTHFSDGDSMHNQLCAKYCFAFQALQTHHSSKPGNSNITSKPLCGMNKIEMSFELRVLFCCRVKSGLGLFCNCFRAGGFGCGVGGGVLPFGPHAVARTNTQPCAYRWLHRVPKACVHAHTHTLTAQFA